jgi:hypothetical protein
MKERLFRPGVVKLVWLASLLVCLLPFLVVSFFAHPFYDDYCMAARTLKYGLWGALKHAYFNTDGRYFTNALLRLHPLGYGSTLGYKLGGVLVILLLFAAVYILAGALFKAETSRVERLIAAAFFTALYSNQMPELTEGYYWMTGAVVYMVGVAMMVFFFVSVAKLFESRGTKRALLVALSLILIAAVVGSNETQMAIFFLLLLVITVKTFVKRDAWLWLSFLLTATACAIFVLTAPGNALRSAHFPNRHRLFYSLALSSVQEVYFLLKWFSNPALIMGTILFIPLAYRLSERSELVRNHFNLHPLMALLMLVGVVFMGFFPPYWSMGQLGQHRTANLVFFLFLLGWFLNLAVWVGYLRVRRALTVAPLPRYVYVICLLLIPLSLLTTNNNREALGDLVSGRAYRYDVQRRERNSRIEQCLRTNESPCVISRLTDLPASITSDYTDTMLYCDELYWKLQLTHEEPK